MRPGQYDEAIARLKPQEGIPVTFEEISLQVGCTKAYIQFIAERALRKLRIHHPEAAAWLDSR